MSFEKFRGMFGAIKDADSQKRVRLYDLAVVYLANLASPPLFYQNYWRKMEPASSGQISLSSHKQETNEDHYPER